MKCSVVYNHDVPCDADADEEMFEEDIEDINKVWLVPGYELTRRPDGTAGTCNEHMELMGVI